MNYRHLFHAGNFADVFKHAALDVLLRALHSKPAPICYLDMHAGAGRYDLDLPDARKSGEYRDGIGRLWDLEPQPAELADYLAAVRELNPDGRLRFYPGSPRIARRLLRAQDRMLLCERQPEEYLRLKTEFADDPQVAVHERDAYEALKALLPPTPRRGLVLVDPPYEQPNEVDKVMDGLETARRRWATGIYVLWYPIKDRATVTRLHERLRAGGWPKVLVAELNIFPEDTAFRLNGSGLALMNPPWEFQRIYEPILTELGRCLDRGSRIKSSMRWIANE